MIFYRDFCLADNGGFKRVSYRLPGFFHDDPIRSAASMMIDRACASHVPIRDAAINLYQRDKPAFKVPL